MDTRELGKTGEKVPVIGLGTWKISRGDEGVESVTAGMEAGMRFVDTAEMYGNEDMVGLAIKGQRDIFLATKVSPDHFHYEDVIRACNASLKRLGRKQIDLYQLHWPNTGIPIAETMKAMEKLVDDGKIRYIGVSNFSIDEMAEAQESMKRYEIVSNQVEYSIITRGIEDGLLEFCNDVGATVIAYSPFGSGKLFERKYAGLLSLLDHIGITYSKMASQVALNWVISHKGVVAIPKAGSRDHIKENAEAASFSISSNDLIRIRDALADYPGNRPIVGSLSPIMKRTSSFWGRVMRYRETVRGMSPTSMGRSRGDGHGTGKKQHEGSRYSYKASK